MIHRDYSSGEELWNNSVLSLTAKNVMFTLISDFLGADQETEARDAEALTSTPHEVRPFNT